MGQNEPLFITIAKPEAQPMGSDVYAPFRFLKSEFGKNAKAQEELEQFGEQLGVPRQLSQFATGGLSRPIQQAPKIFKGFKDLTTKTVEKLKGRSTVSRQFIEDLSNTPDLKQAERDLIRNTLKDEGATVDVPKFANKVRGELLPLKVGKPVSNRIDSASGMTTSRYENITLPDELRGPVASYGERVYNSPIKTSAGDVHFSGMPGNENYFAHTRIEDLADAPKSGKTYDEIQTMLDDFEKYPAGSKKRAELRKQQETANDFQHGDTSAGASTRRVIEIQSDLFQKGRLEGEMAKAKGTRGYRAGTAQEVEKLEPYRNTWWERVVREEVKQAAQDGKTKLQFPTGETAMKIEGLGELTRFYHVGINADRPVLANQLREGLQVHLGQGQDFVITDVLGDGKFKAVPRNVGDSIKAWTTVKDTYTPPSNQKYLARNSQTGEVVQFNTSKEADNFIEQQVERATEQYAESFDISGKVDTNNPIYKFYEKEVGRYLTNKYGAKTIIDPQGVKWFEVDVNKDMKKLPIEAFGVGTVPLLDDKKEKRGKMFKSEPLFVQLNGGKN